jgi:hypothetical protein
MKINKLIVLGLIAFAAAGCNKSVVQKAQAPADSNNQNQTLSEEFSKSYQSGYEGYFSTINYKLNYPKGFTVSNDKDNPSKINIDDASDLRQSTTQIFNNDAAGFSSSKEFWSAMNPCADCSSITKTLNLKDAKDVLVYENSKAEWIVYQHDPGFVLIQINKPVSIYEDIYSTLDITVDKNTVHP